MSAAIPPPVAVPAPPGEGGPIASPRRALWNMFAKGASIAVERGAQLALVLVAAPILGVAAFGRYSFAASLGAILAFGTDLGLTIWTTRTLARDTTNSAAILSTGLRLRVGASGVVLLALAGIALASSRPDLKWAILALGIANLARALVDHARAVFRAHERLEDEATVNGAIALLATIGGLSALALTHRGLPALVAGVMLGTLAGAAFGFVRLSRYGHGLSLAWSTPLDLALTRTMLRESMPFWLAGILTLIYARADVILLDLLSTESEVGAYRAARQIIEVASNLPVLLLTALFPQLARAFEEPGPRLVRLENHIALLLVFGGLAVGGTLALIAAPSIHLLLGPEFARSIPTLRILAAATPLLFLNAGLLHFFIARDRARLNVVFAGGMVVVNLTANVLFAHALGAVGSGVAALATELALTLCCLVAMRALRKP